MVNRSLDIVRYPWFFNSEQIIPPPRRVALATISGTGN
jgi:hypothetical protein